MSFADFVRERQYLHNVSPSTLSWYTHALKWLPSESPSQNDLKESVLRMREKGLDKMSQAAEQMSKGAKGEKGQMKKGSSELAKQVRSDESHGSVSRFVVGGIPTASASD